VKTKTLFPWPGGKTRLLQHLLPLLSDNPHHTYVEAFAGAAALLFSREPAKVEVLNDTHGELVRLYRVVANHLDEFVRQFRWALTSREMFRWAQLQHVDTLTDIQRAVRFFYLQRLAFSGKAAGQTFGTGARRANTINLLRLHRVVVEQLPWADCLTRYDTPETLEGAHLHYLATGKGAGKVSPGDPVAAGASDPGPPGWTTLPAGRESGVAGGKFWPSGVGLAIRDRRRCGSGKSYPRGMARSWGPNGRSRGD